LKVEQGEREHPLCRNFSARGSFDVPCRAGNLQYQVCCVTEALEQIVGQQGVTIGPANIEVGLVSVKAVGQPVVGGFDHTVPGAGKNRHTAHRDTQHARIARQAEFVRRRGARHDAHVAKPPAWRLAKI